MKHGTCPELICPECHRTLAPPSETATHLQGACTAPPAPARISVHLVTGFLHASAASTGTDVRTRVRTDVQARSRSGIRPACRRVPRAAGTSAAMAGIRRWGVRPNMAAALRCADKCAPQLSPSPELCPVARSRSRTSLSWQGEWRRAVAVAVAGLVCEFLGHFFGSGNGSGFLSANLRPGPAGWLGGSVNSEFAHDAATLAGNAENDQLIRWRYVDPTMQC